MKQGYTENVSVDEGVDEYGTRTILHFEGDSFIVQKQWDAQPHLERAQAMREAQEGQRWGDGKFIGHIPPVILGQALRIADNEERKRFILTYLREHPQFVGYSPFLRG